MSVFLFRAYTELLRLKVQHGSSCCDGWRLKCKVSLIRAVSKEPTGSKFHLNRRRFPIQVIHPLSADCSSGDWYCDSSIHHYRPPSHVRIDNTSARIDFIVRSRSNIGLNERVTWANASDLRELLGRKVVRVRNDPQSMGRSKG